MSRGGPCLNSWRRTHEGKDRTIPTTLTSTHTGQKLVRNLVKAAAGILGFLGAQPSALETCLEGLLCAQRGSGSHADRLPAEVEASGVPAPSSPTPHCSSGFHGNSLSPPASLPTWHPPPPTPRCEWREGHASASPYRGRGERAAARARVCTLCTRWNASVVPSLQKERGEKKKRLPEPPPALRKITNLEEITQQLMSSCFHPAFI